MGSIYAQPGQSSGSVYAKSGTIGAASPAKKSGGGLFGKLGSAGHWLGQKTELAAHDLKSVPGGLILIAEQPAKNVVKAVKHPSAKNIVDAINPDKVIGDVGKAQVKQAAQTIEHPLRDPFQTLTLLSPALHGAGGLVERAGAVGEAARSGEGAGAVAKALVKKPEVAPRVLRSGDKEVSLIPSRNAGVRVAQRAYDRTLQKGLDEKPQGRVAAHAQKRIGGALSEENRAAQRMRATDATMLDKAALKLSKLPGKRRVEQAALELTSTNTTAEKAAAYHRAQAEKGIATARNSKAADLYQRVHDQGLLTTNEHGDVVVDAAKHPRLAQADVALAKAQGRGDEILKRYEVRSPEALAERINAPARVREGAHYEKPTPGKLGVESNVLTAAKTRVARLEKTHERETTKAIGRATTDDLIHYHNPAEQSPIVARVSGALSLAKEDVQRLEDAAAKRVKPTGLVGGETARPGRGFIGYRASEKRLAKSELSAARGPVIGAAKSPVDSKSFTGRSIEHGLIPRDVTGAASRHLRQILRFENTDLARRQALETGSPLRRSTRDVLVRVPDEQPGKISADIRQALGQEHSNIDSAEELATHTGISAALEMFRSRILDRLPESEQAAIGAEAPQGYRWVDRGALGDLLKAPPGPRGRLGRGVDTVNSAVTAATVYFKIGHIGTRVLTNAATNIIQGSAGPRQIAKSVELWHGLSDTDRARLLAASGQHGFSALPHEGTNVVAHIASKGAGWWARHADAPFRFNALAYELRRIGYSTPEQVRGALDAVERQGRGLPAHEWSKLSAAVRRADREAISYDRLNDFEKRYITRAVWFYPWIKGASLFTVRTMLEHPYKTAVIGAAGGYGREQQARLLGDVPTYEGGLISLGGGSNPLTTDFSTFSPFSTPADLLDALSNRETIAGQFNPAVGAAGQLAYGLNQYGSSSKQPYLDALRAVAAATPEQQLAESIAARNSDQSQKMFPKSPGGTALRFLLGPATPRRVNKLALAKAAARQRSGQR